MNKSKRLKGRMRIKLQSIEEAMQRAMRQGIKTIADF